VRFLIYEGVTCISWATSKLVESISNEGMDLPPRMDLIIMPATKHSTQKLSELVAPRGGLESDL